MWRSSEVGADEGGTTASLRPRRRRGSGWHDRVGHRNALAQYAGVFFLCLNSNAHQLAWTLERDRFIDAFIRKLAKVREGPRLFRP
jgi:hypothetical protein